MMRLTRWAPALFLIALAVVSWVVPATAAAAVKSTVTIVSGEGTEFTGKVTSPKQKCRTGRTVKLFRQDDTGGEDKLAGTAKTNKAGSWTMDGSFLAGIYFARVLPAVFHLQGMAIRCAGDVSLRQHF